MNGLWFQVFDINQMPLGFLTPETIDQAWVTEQADDGDDFTELTPATGLQEDFRLQNGNYYAGVQEG